MKKIFLSLNTILTSKQKKIFFLVLFLIFFGVILELIGLGAILPFLIILTDKEKIIDYLYFDDLKIAFLNASEINIIILAIVLLVLIYVLKNTYLAFLVWVKNKFTFILVKDLSKRLLKIYINKNYSFHLDQNSSTLIRNINVEAKTFSSRYMLSIIDLIINSLILIFAAVLIFLIEPIISTIISVIFLISFFIYYFIIRKKIISYGIERHKYEGKILLLLREIFGNIKIINLFEKQNFFVKNYNVFMENYLNPVIKSSFYNELPRLFFEVVAIILFGIIILFMFGVNSKSFQEVLPTLGFFIVATYKILPSLSKILIQIQNIKFSEPVVNLFLTEFKLENNNKMNNLKNLDNKNNLIKFQFENLQINNLSFSYNKRNQIFDNLNLLLKKGSVYGLVGGSGKGKSTLLDLIMGLQNPDNGRIVLNSQYNLKDCLKHWQTKIGYVPQNIVLLDDTIKNNIAFGIEDKDIDEVKLNYALETSQIKKYLDNLEDGINTTVGENGARLSGGQKQRIGIARALYFKPEILLLDEITSSIDHETEKKIIYDIIESNKDKTIVMITHKIFDKKIFDTIYEVSNYTLNKIK